MYESKPADTGSCVTTCINIIDIDLIHFTVVLVLDSPGLALGRRPPEVRLLLLPLELEDPDEDEDDDEL